MNYKMRLIIIGIIFVVLFHLSAADGNYNDNINQGASTSKVGNQEQELSELTDSEKCEIDFYVESILVLLTEEIEGNNEDVVDKKLQEMLSYPEYLRIVIFNIRYGENADQQNNFAVLANHRQRMDYLTTRISAKISESIFNRNSDEFSEQLHCKNIRDKVHKIISLQKYETSTSSPTEYIKNSYGSSSKTQEARQRESSAKAASESSENRKQSSKSESHQKLYNRIRSAKARAANQPYKVRLNTEKIRTTTYNIIPLPLIQKFFEHWIRASIDVGLFTRPDCPNAAYLTNILFKLTGFRYTHPEMVMDGFQHQSRYNNTISEILQRLSTWTPAGNQFEGPLPRRRTPFWPAFGLHGEDALGAFEIYSQFLLDAEHFNELKRLFLLLHKYLRITNLQGTPYQRFGAGNEVFLTLMITMMGRRLTPFNENQWEEAEIDERQLERLSENQRRLYRGKKFLRIKKKEDSEDPGRSKRSISEEITDKKTCEGMPHLASRRFSQLALYMFYNFMEAASLEKSTLWSCNFMNLYYEYLIAKNESDSSKADECTNLNFDSFLYSKISDLLEWKDCVNYNSNTPRKWCKAWRNIMLNSNVGDAIKWNQMKIKEFNQDTEIFLLWLLEKIKAPSRDQGKQKFQSSPVVGLQIKKSIVTRLCHNSTDQATIACPNYCKINSARSRRSINMEVEVLFDKEWFKDIDNQMKCECPKNTSTAKNSFISVAWQQLVNFLFGHGCKTEEQRSSPRCDELRR